MDAATIFIVVLIVAIFVVDAGFRWWHGNRWRYRRRDDDSDASR